MDNNSYEILGAALTMALAAYSDKLVRDKILPEKIEYKDIEGRRKIKEIKDLLDKNTHHVAKFVDDFKRRAKQHGELFDAQLETIEEFRRCR